MVNEICILLDTFELVPGAASWVDSHQRLTDNSYWNHWRGIVTENTACPNKTNRSIHPVHLTYRPSTGFS